MQSYLRPFLRSFGVSLFILVLQFLSRYKDDIFGKGLEAWVLIKIFAFASIALIVLAFPVSVLLSSLFAMGNFGENYELAAMRAGGMSVPRILRPMIVATLFIAMLSFGMSSYVVPWANLKLYSLLYDVQQMKPTFTLKPGHFNAAIDKYVIRIEDKDVSKDMLYRVMIFDHTSGHGNDRVVIADSGIMRSDPYGRYMNMTLFNGVSYEAMLDEHGVRDKKEGFVRFYYDTLFYNFDISGFKLERTDEEAFSTHQYMLNLSELGQAIDSIEVVKDDVKQLFAERLGERTKLDSVFWADTSTVESKVPGNIIKTFPRKQRLKIMERALKNARQVRDLTGRAVDIIEEEDRRQRERLIEYHGKFALPMACIIFLFIGAPLGALIRKGGVGIPIMVSITFFLAFYVLMIQGKKMATEDVMPVWTGTWLPVLVMLPLAIFFTFESTSRARLLSSDRVWQIWQKLGPMLLWLFPLYWLWRVPVLQRLIILLLRPIVRLFPNRGR